MNIKGFLAGVVTVAGLVIAVLSFTNDLGGSVKAKYSDKKLKNNEERHIVIFFDEREHFLNLSKESMQPQFYASGFRTVKEPFIRYSIKSDGCRPILAKSLSSEGTGGIVEVSQRLQLLSNTDTMPYALLGVELLQDKSVLEIHTEANWNGSITPYGYTANYSFFSVPRNKKNDEEWMRNCMETLISSRIADGFDEVDLLFCMKGGMLHSELNVSSSNLSNVRLPVVNRDGGEQSDKKSALSLKNNKEKENPEISIKDVQVIFDDVSNGKMSSGQALGTLTKGKVNLANQIEGCATLTELFHEMEFGYATGEPTYYRVIGFKTSNGKIVSGTLVVEKMN